MSREPHHNAPRVHRANGLAMLCRPMRFAGPRTALTIHDHEVTCPRCRELRRRDQKRSA